MILQNISPTPYVYGYQIDQVAAVKYLVDTQPLWATSYQLLENHDQAMRAIAKELSEHSGLTIDALPLWVGGHRTNYGMVFLNNPIIPGKSTPEDAEKLKKLESSLVSMGVSNGTPKFEELCSASYPGHPAEPPEMAKKPPPHTRNIGAELLRLGKGLGDIYPLANGQQAKRRTTNESVEPSVAPPKKKRKTARKAAKK